MSIKFKLIIPALSIALLITVNIILLSGLDALVNIIYTKFNIIFDYTILLIVYSSIVSLGSYFITKKLLINYNILNEKQQIEKELRKALSDIKNSNREMKLEIADRRKVEKALVESENQIREIIQKAPTGIALLDKEGWILECNPALQNMLGYDENELTGVLFVQAIHPQDIVQFKRKFSELMNGNIDVCKINTRYIHKEFQEVWGSLSASIVRDAENQPQFVIAMVEDITTKQRVEERIVNYQKQLQSLTSELSLIEERERRQIATNLHDHVGQVLTLIGIKIDEVYEKVGTDSCASLIPEIRKLIRQTIKSIRSLMFELSPPILYDLGLEEAIEWLAEHFSQEYQIKIQVSKDEQPKPLKGERNIILFQSLKELLSNIVKHSHANFVKISIQRACNDFRIIVEDNGIGFDINLIDHNKNKIKGFGLFTIYERLEYVGGSMIIESTLNQGTKITLLMPMVFNDKIDYYKFLSNYNYIIKDNDPKHLVE
jgi:PAS domain S-box-containing protein